jgi:alpha-D-ribose 1-methylphosphonate 5-triphosphate synthase subunit PhnH
MAIVESESVQEREARLAFLCMLNALSRPALPVELPASQGAGIRERLALLGHALLDMERSYFAASTALEDQLRVTGAWTTRLERADYVFFESLGAGDLALLKDLRVGEFANPDYGATLFVGCEIDAAEAPLRCLRGPGIADKHVTQIGGVPEAFWELRDSLIRYPLGFDVFFVGASEIIGLPRTTQVTRCM